MNRKLKFSLILCALALSSCQKGCNRLERNVQKNSPRNYEVIMFSGGDTVLHDKFNGILNTTGSQGGLFYFKGDTLVELTGDYVVKSVE